MQHARILLAARRREELEKVAAECKTMGAATVDIIVADVSREPDCKAISIKAEIIFHDGIDVLVLNAGIGMRGRVDQVQDTAIYHNLLAVNTMGAVLVTHYCMPLLLRGGGSKGGHIVIVSSVSGLLGLPGLAGYCMSKAALHGFFDALRNEGPIGVTTVCPGFMDTEMPQKNMGVDGKPVAEHDAMDRGKAWSPEYVAKQIVIAAHNKTRDLVFDRPIKAALLFRHWFPSLLDTLIRRRFSSHSKL